MRDLICYASITLQITELSKLHKNKNKKQSKFHIKELTGGYTFIARDYYTRTIPMRPPRPDIILGPVVLSPTRQHNDELRIGEMEIDLPSSSQSIGSLTHYSGYGGGLRIGEMEHVVNSQRAMSMEITDSEDELPELEDNDSFPDLINVGELRTYSN